MFHPYNDIEVASTTTFCRPNAPIFPLIAESRCFSGTFIIIFIRLLRKLELIKCWIWANTWRHIVSPTNHLIRVYSSPRKGVNYSGIRMQFPRLSCTWWKSITHRHRGAICVSLESGYNPCLMTRDKRAVEQWMRGGDTVKSKIRMPACDHWLWHLPRLQKYWAVNSDFLPHLVPIHIRRGLASCLGIRRAPASYSLVVFEATMMSVQLTTWSEPLLQLLPCGPPELGYLFASYRAALDWYPIKRNTSNTVR